MKFIAGSAPAALILFSMVTAAPIDPIVATPSGADIDVTKASRRDSNARIEHIVAGWNDLPVHDWKRGLDSHSKPEPDHELSADPKQKPDHDSDESSEPATLDTRAPRWRWDRGWNNRPGQAWKRDVDSHPKPEPDHELSAGSLQSAPKQEQDHDSDESSEPADLGPRAPRWRGDRGWNNRPGQAWKRSQRGWNDRPGQAWKRSHRGWNDRPGQTWKRDDAADIGSEPVADANDVEQSVKRDADARGRNRWNDMPGQAW